MRNFLFLFLIFVGASCNPKTSQASASPASGCSFEPKILLNECGSALLGAMDCSDCSSYVWSNGAQTQFISVTMSGNYKVTVTSNTSQCTSVAQLSVQVAPPCNQGCSFDILTTSTCGQATLEVANCPDCFAYVWSNGATSKVITVTNSGTYAVTVTGGGGACTSKASKTVSINHGPTVQIQGNSSFCEGESTTLTAVGSSNCFYLWSTGANTKSITVNTSGNYSVTVVDLNGCSTVATASVTKVAKPETPWISYVLNGNNITLSTVPSAFYQWSNGATTPSITVPMYQGLNVRLFTVKVKNHNGLCWSNESCAFPLFPAPSCCGNGNDGTSPDNCNKTGITASNGMLYGTVFVPTSSQLFLFAPSGSIGHVWNFGQTGGDQGWIFVKTDLGTHNYTLDCQVKVNNQYVQRSFCFQYTILPNFNGGGHSNKSAVPSYIDINTMFIPEEYKEEIQEFLDELEIQNQELKAIQESETETRSNSDYPKAKISAFPNPTTDGSIQLDLSGVTPGSYLIQAINIATGVKVDTKIVKLE